MEIRLVALHDVEQGKLTHTQNFFCLLHHLQCPSQMPQVAATQLIQ